MYINIIEFGAIPDGVTDNWSVFQRAENEIKNSDGYGEIFVPAGNYLVSQPFFHWSNITLSGEGKDSLIFNTNAAGSSGDDEFCILIGNMKPSSFSKCTHYKAFDTVEGQRHIKLRRKTDLNLANFVVGEPVLIDSASGWIGNGNDFKPYSAYVNRISAIDKAAGVIYLEDAIPDAVIGTKIAKAKNSNAKEYVCMYPVIQNMAFQSKGNWTLRWGCYKGVFRNLWIKSTDIIGGNAISHCTFENIAAFFTQKIFEMATYSHENTVNGVIATWYDGFKDPAPKPLLVFGENCRRCTLTDLHVDSGLMGNMQIVARFEHAFSNVIEDSFFTVNEITGTSVSFEGSDTHSVVVGNKVTGCEFNTAKSRAHIEATTQGNGSNVSGNEASGNTFKGAIINKPEIGDALQQNTIAGNTYL